MIIQAQQNQFGRSLGKVFGCPSISEIQAGAAPPRTRMCYMLNHPVLLAPWVAGGLALILILAMKKRS